MERKKLITPIIFAIVGSTLSPTLGEFAAASINRYSAYPTGTDTNLLANSLSFSLLILIVSFVPVLRLAVKRAHRLSSVVFVVLVLSIFAIWFFEPVPSFVPKEWCKYELKIYPCQHYEPVLQDMWNNVIDNDNK